MNGAILKNAIPLSLVFMVTMIMVMLSKSQEDIYHLTNFVSEALT
tara:strand:- start:61 stop:195 length:135 start_codon:yes stop_codon:yes gene_type:complete